MNNPPTPANAGEITSIMTGLSTAHAMRGTAVPRGVASRGTSASRALRGSRGRGGASRTPIPGKQRPPRRLAAAAATEKITDGIVGEIQLETVATGTSSVDEYLSQDDSASDKEEIKIIDKSAKRKSSDIDLQVNDISDSTDMNTAKSKSIKRKKKAGSEGTPGHTGTTYTAVQAASAAEAIQISTYHANIAMWSAMLQGQTNEQRTQFAQSAQTYFLAGSRYFQQQTILANFQAFEIAERRIASGDSEEDWPLLPLPSLEPDVPTTTPQPTIDFATAPKYIPTYFKPQKPVPKSIPQDTLLMLPPGPQGLPTSPHSTHAVDTDAESQSFGAGSSKI